MNNDKVNELGAHEEVSDSADELSNTFESWKLHPLELSSETSSSINSEPENLDLIDNEFRLSTSKKGKALIGKKSVAKNKKEESTVDAKPTSDSFNPNDVPDFLSLPNEDVCHILKEKQFEKWNLAYTNWFLDKDQVAAKKPSIKTIRGYSSELCRYALYVHESMKRRNVDWNLNDILNFNTAKGSSFNSKNGITFFEDPTQYMIDEDLPLSRKLKFLMSLVHAIEMIASTIIAGKKGCTLTIEE